MSDYKEVKGPLVQFERSCNLVLTGRCRVMKSRVFRNGVSGVLCLFISNIPAVAVADSKMEMIPTQEVVEGLSKEQTLEAVQGYLSREDVQAELIKRGLSPDEVSQRLASLSEQEMKQLSSQVAQAKAGGDILVTIVLVLLIIFLIKRI